MIVKSVFKSNYVDVHYDDEQKMLMVLWTYRTESLTDPQFQEHVRAYAKLTDIYTVEKIFVDAVKYKHLVSKPIHKWHDEEIVPHYVANGVKKMAFLQPEGLFAQMGHQFIFDEKKAKDLLDVRFFDNEAKAKEWLSL